MFERDPGKLALRIDRRCTSAIEYGFMAAFVMLIVVTFAGVLTPRLPATFSNIALAMNGNPGALRSAAPAVAPSHDVQP